RTPKAAFFPRSRAPGSHQTTEYPDGVGVDSTPNSNTCWPGQTVDGNAGSSLGRCSTESFDLNAGHFGPRVAPRRLATGGYKARLSGLNHPPSQGPSPSAGTTSR